MRILVLRSQRRPTGAQEPAEHYIQVFGSNYAEKVVANLVGERSFCSACGPDCNACREPYGRRFGDQIVGQITFPAVLPYLLEDPAQYVPGEIPPHDILLAVNVHEQILLEVLKRCGELGTRGVVVPIEAGDWISGSAAAQAEEICTAGGIEIALPKPFCAFDPPGGTVLAEFRRQFHVGKPAVRLTVRDETIQAAHVDVSAACGATYYVARWLVGRSIHDDLKYDVVAKRMHSYPCTASMKWDDEIGETILHVAGQAHYEILAPLAGRPLREAPTMVRSPLGRMVQRPISPRENLAQIARAKEAILEHLATGGEMSLEDLRKARRIPPAAMSTAMILLKQEGKIRTDAGKIAPP